MNVPFVDLKAQYRSIKQEIDTAIQTVINEAAFIRGKYVERFEDEFALIHNVKQCVSCGNGTDAIYIALKALGIGVGDEVITTALSWISTSEMVSQTGAKVVFADIEPEYFTIDPAQIEEKITEKTRAIIPVHIYGQAADMDVIMAIAGKYGLAVIEDCAQAHLARYKGQVVGTFGDVGTFSFYPGKNLGAYGDAGAIISNDEQLARRARIFANHGAYVKHQHQVEGINSRMDGIQASILSAKLKYLNAWTQQRRIHGYNYNKLLTKLDGVEIPLERKDCEHVYHLYVIRSQKRSQLQDYLKAVGIETGIHYPVCLPFLQAYNYLGHSESEFPVCSRYQEEILSLPIYPELTKEMCDYVVQEIKECLG
jgi:dTDP-4-amino-4,6-dideoxygalactose transaminase